MLHRCLNPFLFFKCQRRPLFQVYWFAVFHVMKISDVVSGSECRWASQSAKSRLAKRVLLWANIELGPRGARERGVCQGESSLGRICIAERFTKFVWLLDSSGVKHVMSLSPPTSESASTSVISWTSYLEGSYESLFLMIMHKYIHAYMHTYIRAYMNAYIHIFMHTFSPLVACTVFRLK